MSNEILIKNISNFKECNLSQIGFDSSYTKSAAEKYKYKNIKLYNLTLAQANILKQTALSVGADCAMHKEVITAGIEKTDCILGATIKQMRMISDKLCFQPFGLKDLADNIIQNIEFKLPVLTIKNRTFDFSRPYIVGILNLTLNSFSDGGEFYEFEAAKNHLLKLINDGADIIDIGAESTKPSSSPVSEQEQLKNIIPLLEFIKQEGIDIPISIDTRSSNVAEKCINSGADIINDVSGLDFDENIADVAAKYNRILVIQHSQGSPETMQINPQYENLLDDIYTSLSAKINKALNKGMKKENIIADVGIGFGKTKEQNFELLNNIQDFCSLQCPMMVGVSRKSLLGMQDADNAQKDIYTLALNSLLIDKGVNFIRVHNVELTQKLLELRLGQ